MRRTFAAALLCAVLGASASAQVRGEFGASGGGSAVRAIPAFAGQSAPAPALVSPAQAFSLGVSASLSAPSAVAPSAASALAVLPAASAPTPLPPSAAAPAAAAADSPAAPAHADAAKAATSDASHPRDWDFGRWRQTLPTEDAASWRFQDGWLRDARLWDGSRQARALGAGAMGSVFVHPGRSDAVVKVARKGYADAAGQFMAPDDETVLSYEDYDLARLAALGAAPRTLARVTVSGRPASVRERVGGRTLAELKRMGRFGARERRLVLELIGRIADGGFVARDLNFGNIMIGFKGGSGERAWLVDTLGVSVRDDLDAAGRRAEMLADRVPWIAFQGFGLGRPLSKALDSAVGSRLGYDRTPIAWPKWARWTALAGLLGLLAAAPPLLHAAPFGAPLSLGLLPSAPVFAAVAAVIALAGIPVRQFAHRLAPWVMTRGRDQGDEIMRTPAWKAVPLLALGAASEEIVFRGALFLAGALLLHALLPAAAAIAAASFLSSTIFALVHGYGSVWTRVVGGLLYTAAFVASGSLLLPIAAHFGFNLALYVHGRYLR